MINIGIIGLGVIAKYYLAALVNSNIAILKGVCDLNPQKIYAYLSTQIAVYTDYRDLLKDPEIDAVIINLPNSLHFTACKDALAHGKHVCCEKPLTLSVNEAKQLQHIAKAANRTLFTAFHRRYNQPMIELKAKLPSFEGVAKVELYYLEKIEEHAGHDTWYLDPAACGGGCIADNGPNAFDTLIWLIGALSVKNVSITRDEKELDIKAVIDLENKQGIMIRTFLDWTYPQGEDKRVVIFMKDGTTLSGDMLQGCTTFKASLFHEYERVIDDFSLHIAEKRGSGEEGIAAVELVNECYDLDKKVRLYELS
ncbi:Gfo/Idh/MocA family protein [Brenneria tiliae]|uniref:Gfo/Idh/MocA family protein n=1 Tax=Brenneria tiliae TaxID=2914984 RepID=UPI002014D195|nr:Gfo/Idh/MocA family oxidoreductase [Brenneria tiliae]MCL2897123.1 Gfo/Idh/MocA family oxidoreductase [Brenneria tiliae]MCL2904776.1 Gfo/Idh/MocA family oxidoreductase [Brenneria tiliae]